MKSIDPFSLISLRINLYFRDTLLSSATGFVIEKEGQLYLVTNWHVVSGRHPETDKLLDQEKKSYPNCLKISYYSFLESKWVSLKCELYDGEDEYHLKKGAWLEHPLKNNVDVVLLPIGKKDEHSDMHIFDLKWANQDIAIAPALTVSVLGFPLEERNAGKLPVWITGFIASEPGVNIRNLPLFYVNAAGYSGLSGSPVILRTNGSYISIDGHYKIGVRHNKGTIGYPTRFLGIYSGRIKEKGKAKEDDLALCHVWKPKVIEEIYQYSLGQGSYKTDQYQLMTSRKNS